MSKKKENIEVQASDIADASPVEMKSPPELVARIQTEEQARALVKTLYTVPDHVKVVIVTEDRNVFWKENEGSAVNHAHKHNLKLFRLTWD